MLSDPLIIKPLFGFFFSLNYRKTEAGYWISVAKLLKFQTQEYAELMRSVLKTYNKYQRSH